MKIVIKILGKVAMAILLVVVALVIVTGISPIYNFQAPKAFEGPDLFNPYAALDTAAGWKRANFHTHTRVKGPFPPNECEEWPQETWNVYERLGYDIVTFSNHNEITTHPFDTALQVNVYEQGYSPYKFHKLVFGSKGVIHWDPLVPLFASQKQFELDMLDKSSDFIQINHPYRTWGMSKSHMEKFTGYDIMELDTNIGTENEYWDWALSAGHYSFGLANDDLHHAHSARHIALRCNFLCTPSGRYEDLRETLLSGCYYAMRVPNYGDGDWDVKIAKNHQLPMVTNIGLDGNRIFIELSRQADSIRVNGQDHAVLAFVKDASAMEYEMKADDPYARFTAFFPEGEVIYSNPFARFDASAAATPVVKTPHPVNVPLTILWNLLLLGLLAGVIVLFIKIFK